LYCAIAEPTCSADASSPIPIILDGDIFAPSFPAPAPAARQLRRARAG
jgi:hypothetical protein